MSNQQRSITAQDLYKFNLISEPQLSPDGEIAVYALHRVDQKTEKKYVNLWIVPTLGGEERQYTTGDHSDTNPRFSPDGTKVAFLSNRDDENQQQVYLIPTDGGEARRLTDLKGTIEAFVWSPDGTRLLLQFRAKDQQDIAREKDEEKKKLGVVCREIDRVFFKEDGIGYLPHERHHLRVVDIATGEENQITNGKIYDEWDPGWSPDGTRITFRIAHHGNTVLKSISLSGDLEDVITDPGGVGRFSFDRSGTRLLYFHGNMKDSGQVWIREEGRSHVLTHVNEELLAGIDLGAVEEEWFKGADGNDLQGWILTPPGFGPAQPYPSVLEFHGGPRVQYGNFFMHEFYYLAVQGYVVYFCNPRGGQGYGEEHSKTIWNA